MRPKKQFSAGAYVRKTHDQDVERKISAQHEYRHAPPTHKGASPSLRILNVDPESLAARIGLRSGDQILEVNGTRPRDVIDFQFQLACFGERISIRTERRTVEFVREEWESFGVELEPIEPWVCDNDCVFCFVHQNPANTRRSLRIKDEDYRLSFLFGNYLTLTNVDDPEIARIIEQRLSPLYISVHATEPALRSRLLGNDSYDGLDAKLDRLARAGIVLHCQVVLCPKLNDGIHLERTIEDLSSRHPSVQSVAVVPVGLTDHRDNLPNLDPVTPQYARQTIQHLKPIQKRFLKNWGTPFVFLGDEFYILAGHPIPAGDHYQEFPQIENGVGMVRTFLDEFDAVLNRDPELPKTLRSLKITVCTGRLFHSYLNDCVERVGVDAKTVAVENRFWGSGINVAGLLTGSDFLAALEGNVYGDVVILPSEAMIGDEGLFLDDMKLADVEAALGVPVVRSGYTAGEFLQILRNQTERASSDASLRSL
jgi:putative radical SAM enzyme (TIGR03279 family)